MEPVIAESARKHGVSDGDMLHALRHPVWVVQMDDGLTMFTGGDLTGALIEVGLIDHADGPIVIHAYRPARARFLPR